jgi:hypothetical protein
VQKERRNVSMLRMIDGEKAWLEVVGSDDDGRGLGSYLASKLCSALWSAQLPVHPKRLRLVRGLEAKLANTSCP